MIILSWLTVFLCFCIFSFLLWNLLYRMQGRSRKLKIFYKQEAGWWEKRGHPREGPIESCSVTPLLQQSASGALSEDGPKDCWHLLCLQQKDLRSNLGFTSHQGQPWTNNGHWRRQRYKDSSILASDLDDSAGEIQKEMLENDKQQVQSTSHWLC